MPPLRRILFLPISLLLLMLQSSAHAVTLFGDAQHSELLPASSPELQNHVRRTSIDAGESSAPVSAHASLSQPAIDWMMIPVWMAGTWNKQGDTTISVTDLRSGITSPSGAWINNDMTLTWGHQADRLGNVWHANLIPAERDGLSSGMLVRFVTIAQKSEKNSSAQFVTRTHYVVTETYQGGNSVAEMFQQESLNDYLPVSAVEFDNRSSNKMFTMQGQPYRLGILQAKWRKIAQFQPTASERGIDLREALAAYLHSQNLDNLIPAQ